MRPSDPERDRRLAQRARYGHRRAANLDEAVGGYFASAEVQRIRRFQRVAPALVRTLPPELLRAVSPVRLQEGALTLEVADGVACTNCASTMRLRSARPWPRLAPA
jgi:hypothetical protein